MLREETHLCDSVVEIKLPEQMLKQILKETESYDTNVPLLILNLQVLYSKTSWSILCLPSRILNLTS